MKLNQWTLGLAAVGAVSLVSAVRADDAKVSQVQTVLANTTLSGYVDTAAQYNLGNVGVDGVQGPGLNNSKIDNFSLNDIDLALDHPEDDSPWAAGYHVDLNFGTDAIEYYGQGSTYDNSDVFGIRQAYISLHTPVGNGIDWKVGIQDNIIGYEGNTDGANPNYTRSYGYTLEPTTWLGLIGTYKINSLVTVEAGIANSYLVNTVPGSIPGVNNTSTSAKAYVGDVAFTAPSSWGWASGATLNVGVNAQFADGGSTTVRSQDNYWAGLTLPTPWAALKFGAAFDLVSYADELNTPLNSKDDSQWVGGVYATYQATDKLSLNLRGEYDKDDLNANQGEEATATIQYNLWANVLSRAEFRWDHVEHGTQYGANSEDANAYLAAVNLIYTF